jgi:hypothetical protein
MRYWVLYHELHDSEFSGETFYSKAGPSRGDHAFVILGDKPRNTSYLLAGEYEIASVDQGPYPFKGRAFDRRLHLRSIARPERPILLREDMGLDLDRLRNRHASGVGIKTAEDGVRATFQKLLAGFIGEDDRSPDLAALMESELPRTTVEQQIAARLGQGKFRQNVVDTWSIGERCALTEVSIRDVLTASHIIPWAEDESLRLEGTNGILLCAHADRLFDRHLITFDADGRLVGSTKLTTSHWKELASLGMRPGMLLKTVMMNPTNTQLVFDRLRRHRDRMQELDSKQAS